MATGYQSVFIRPVPALKQWYFATFFPGYKTMTVTASRRNVQKMGIFRTNSSVLPANLIGGFFVKIAHNSPIAVYRIVCFVYTMLTVFSLSPTIPD
jgi:hypothetical protein